MPCLIWWCMLTPVVLGQAYVQGCWTVMCLSGHAVRRICLPSACHANTRCHCSSSLLQKICSLHQYIPLQTGPVSFQRACQWRRQHLWAVEVGNWRGLGHAPLISHGHSILCMHKSQILAAGMSETGCLMPCRLHRQFPDSVLHELEDVHDSSGSFPDA